MANRGSYRHLVRLEHPGKPIPDGLGGYTEVWAPLTPAQWFCAIAPAATRVVERLTAGMIQATATHLVTGDFHPGITTETRLITEEGQTLQVQTVTDVQARRETLILVCAEVVGGGIEPTANRRARGATGSAPRVTH